MGKVLKMQRNERWTLYFYNSSSYFISIYAAFSDWDCCSNETWDFSVAAFNIWNQTFIQGVGL